MLTLIIHHSLFKKRFYNLKFHWTPISRTWRTLGRFLDRVVGEAAAHRVRRVKGGTHASTHTLLINFGHADWTCKLS